MNKISIYKPLSLEETEKLKKDISKNSDLLNETDSGGSSLLQIAVAHNNIELAKFLIEAAIDVNHQDESKNVALHYCAEYYCYEIADYILKNGGRLNIEDKFGNEPLWTALSNVKRGLVGLDLVKLFISYGANKEHENKVKKSPMAYALTLGIKEIIDALNGS